MVFVVIVAVIIAFILWRRKVFLVLFFGLGEMPHKVACLTER